jgi:hypothetical protein
MSVEERLSEECKRIGFNQTEFDHYKAGESSLNVDYWKAVALAGVNVHYILTGQTLHAQLLAAIKASMEKMPGLALADKCKAAVAQLLTALYLENTEQIKQALENIRSGNIGQDSISDGKKYAEAMPDDNRSKLTMTEKYLINAYRKASAQDKSMMDRLAQLTEKAIEADSGIAEDVIDGE